MMHSRQKWRPSLGQITLSVLVVVVMLPLVGLFFFRVIENQLIRETESELIAQTAVLAQVFSRLAEGALPLGAILPDDATPDPSRRFDPILPKLDLASGDLRSSRPDGRQGPPLTRAAADIGIVLTRIGQDVQRTTLAGFRFLDARGQVIGGRDEIGLTFAHVPEVTRALSGHYASTIRSRTRDKPAPPLYSISRGTGIRVFVAMPVVVDQKIAGVIYASRTPNNIVKYFYDERAKLITAGLVVSAVLLMLGAFFIRLINKPVADLIAWTTRVSAGERPDRAPQRGTREIAQLADSFAQMAASLHDRSEYIATFAAHVSHELKSPLTTIQGAAELVRDQEMTATERARFLDTIINDTDRLSRLLDRLRELARAQKPEARGSSCIDDIAQLVAARFPKLRIVTQGKTGARMAISAENLRIVLGHLLDNAAGHGASSVTISAAQGAQVSLMIIDDGPGISERNRNRVFDPFFTTRREKGGTGMGLEIVKSLLDAHRGQITLQPNATGACFEIMLPAATAR